MAKYVLSYSSQVKENSKLKKLFNEVFKYTMEFLNKNTGTYLISLTLIDDTEMQKLNFKYRNVDSSTDVLTLAFNQQNNGDEITDLGDIFISPAIAKKQAVEFNHPYYRELFFLFIHGILHSLGYDHQNDDDSKIMYETQNKIINTFKYDYYTNLNKVKILLKEAQSKAYTPYSNFKVGAVITTKDYKTHIGFNIENSAYGCCMCGERVGLYSTYAQGYKKEDIASLALVTQSKEIGTPCGSCRQVMSELMDFNSFVYIFNDDLTKLQTTSVIELLPGAFTSDNLSQ